MNNIWSKIKEIVERTKYDLFDKSTWNKKNIYYTYQHFSLSMKYPAPREFP